MPTKNKPNPAQTVAIYAKQPIFDQKLIVMGYELLFRPEEQLGHIDNRAANAQLILSTMTSEHRDFTDQHYTFFIQYSAELLLRLPLGSTHYVIELLPTVVVTRAMVVTPAMVNTVKALKARGYKIALADFGMALAMALGIAQLLPFIDIVKIDFHALASDQIKVLVNLLAPYKVKLLAEKVDTQKYFLFAKSLGFDYYQGYFFYQPELSHQCLARPLKLSTLQLLIAVMDPDVEFESLVAMLKTDPILTVKLLRLINQDPHDRVAPIKSLDQALVMLGLTKLRQWVSLIALTELVDSPNELLRQTLLRAIALEKFAQFLGEPQANDCFFIGFLSVIGAFFDRPLTEVLTNLPLGPETRSALLEHSGPLGELLTLLQYMIEGRWEELVPLQDHYPMHQFFRLYLTSEKETEQLLAQFQ